MEYNNEIEAVNYPTDRKVGGSSLSEIKENSEKPKVYLIYDFPDQQLVKEMKNFLATKDYLVSEPDFNGTLIDRRTCHVNNLIQADILLIYYGRENMLWLRTKLLDVLKSPGLGRNKPLPERLVYAAQHVKITKEAILMYRASLICHKDEFPSLLINEFFNKAIKSYAAVSE